MKNSAQQFYQELIKYTQYSNEGKITSYFLENFLNARNINFKKTKYNYHFNLDNTNYIIISNIHHFNYNYSLYSLIIPNLPKYNHNYIFLWDEPDQKSSIFTLTEIKKLFNLLSCYKAFYFNNLIMDNIYFSKYFNQFLFKNIPEYINIEYLLSQNILTFHPKNILEDKSLFKFQNQEISYYNILTTFFNQGGINYGSNNH